MKIQAYELAQAAVYLKSGLELVDIRTVWVRGQLVLRMEFEGERASEVQAEWNGAEGPMLMSEDYRRLIVRLGAKVGQS